MTLIVQIVLLFSLMIIAALSVPAAADRRAATTNAPEAAPITVAKTRLG